MLLNPEKAKQQMKDKKLAMEDLRDRRLSLSHVIVIDSVLMIPSDYELYQSSLSAQWVPGGRVSHRWDKILNVITAEITLKM